MKETIETRELIVLDGLDVIVWGTYHKAYDESSSSQSNLIERDRIGVVFLNSLSPTRAATGDSAVYWADSFAEHGYSSFRLDLPGFGDSAGDPPTELLSFINTGGYASIASAKVKELMGRFDLSGVVVVGLCAGAVSALYTAAAAGKMCKGLVLMDPYFHLPLQKRSKLWDKLTGRISRSALGRLINNTYDRLMAVRVLLLGSTPPSNANFQLLKRWKDVASAGLPILIFKAPGARQRGEFDYLGYILGLAGRKSQVTVEVIEGAGHTFSNHVGRAAVRQRVESWLNTYFPLIGRKEPAVNALRPEPKDSNSYAKRHQDCLHG